MTDESHFFLACPTHNAAADLAKTDCPVRGVFGGALRKLGEWLEAMGECPPLDPVFLLTHGELMGPALYRSARGFGAMGGQS
jgi:hypothetical protein